MITIGRHTHARPCVDHEHEGRPRRGPCKRWPERDTHQQLAAEAELIAKSLKRWAGWDKIPDEILGEMWLARLGPGRPLETGIDPAKLAERWRRRGIPLEFGTLEGRVKGIAQHQLGMLRAEVQREGANAGGVTEFVWRTQGDGRVRDEHRSLDGRTFSYGAPPPEGLPGQPVGRRCWAESVVSEGLLGWDGVHSVQKSR